MATPAVIVAFLGVVQKMYCSCLSSNTGALNKVPIPHSYGRLSALCSSDPTWITGVMKSMGVLTNGSVKTVTLKPFGPSAGYFSELAIMELTYEDGTLPAGLPTSCIVKFLPVGFEKRLILDIVQLPRAECFFYYHLLRHHEQHKMPPLPLKSPFILYCDYCPETNNSMLIMEKIAGDAVLGDQGKPPCMHQARAMSICLAKLHAYFWGGRHPKTSVLSTADSPVIGILAIKMKANTKGMLKMLSEYSKFDVAPSTAAALTSTIPDGMGKFLKFTVDSPYNTVVHGDARLDNVFFEAAVPTSAEPSPPAGTLVAGLYDWAQGVYAPCYYEMAWTISNSWPPDFVRENEDALLRLYWSTLLEEMPADVNKSELDFDDFLYGYYISHVMCVGKCTVAYESISKEVHLPSYPHKKKLVMHGLQNSLYLIEKFKVPESISKVIGGKASHRGNKVAPMPTTK